MKTVSIVVPCFNEEGNVENMCNALYELFEEKLKSYAFEIIFIDNQSTDETKTIIRKLCSEKENVKAIFNVRNFGAFNSPFHAMLQSKGDCTISLACDFQEPVELIPEFLKKWEQGAQVVAGVRSGSKENKFMYGFRSLYYKLMGWGSQLDYIEHFTGFGLYDKSFIDILKAVDDPLPFLRGMVMEFGSKIEKIYYDQPERASGKTHNKLSDLYDAAMLSFTSYTSMGLRNVTIFGFIVGVVSFILGLVYLIYKLIRWDNFNVGLAPLMIGLFFLGAVVLIAVGLIGEYVININRRIMHRPLVIEEERIGFEEENSDDK